jgi:GT2 family glycosyltransferase
MQSNKFVNAYVIVTYNSQAHIDACLESLVQIVREPQRDVVIVVDNGSHDDTLSRLSEWKARMQHLRVLPLVRNIGFGPANNCAFEAFEADHYILINHDAWLLTDSVTPAIAQMRIDPGIAIAGLPLVFPDGSPQTYAYPFSTWKKWLLQVFGVAGAVRQLIGFKPLRWLFEFIPVGREYVRSQNQPTLDIAHPENIKASNAVRDVDWVCGAAMILRGDFVRATGGFDPKIFLYGEDEDICIEAHLRGRRVVAIDGVPLVHKFGWGDSRFNPVVAKLKYESLLYFIEKRAPGKLSRKLMRLLLPLRVYGWSHLLTGASSNKG